MNTNYKNFVVLCFSLLLLISCSSLPGGIVQATGIKKEAASLSKLADGFFLTRQYPIALRYYADSLEKNLSVDNIEGVIAAHNSLGRVYLAINMRDDAAREFNDALEYAKSYAQPDIIAQCLSNIGEMHYTGGKLDMAENAFKEALPLAEKNKSVYALILHNLGITAMAKKNYADAEYFINQAVKINKKINNWVNLGVNYYALASIARSYGKIDEAIALAKNALEADKTAEHSIGIASDLVALAKLNIEAGNDDYAFDYYRRAFGAWLALARTDEAKACLLELGRLSIKLDKLSYIQRYELLLKKVEGADK